MFVDNVCKQVVERHLIRDLPKVFQPESIVLLSDEDLRRIAAEPQRRKKIGANVSP
jgi:hypothetical protein